jgi:parvulin-like peptidyl-prolyl isomerase
MTSRSKPTRTRTLDERERRNMLLNLGFGLTIVAALLLLVIAWGASWYGDHLSAAATVNGQTITKDAWHQAVKVNQFRADYQLRRIRTLLAAGHINTSDAEARQSAINSRLQSVDTLSLSQLIDGAIQADLATKQGVSVSPADIDARLTDEATTGELRHAWVIAVKPDQAATEATPSDAEIAAAQAKATQALTDLKSGQSGKDWDSIAKAVSTDATKDKAGDLGYIDKNASLDAAFLAALLAAPKDTPTDVVKGADGIFRIGRVSDIIAPAVDATLASQVTDDGISMDDFRAALQRDVVHQKLSDAITAPFLAAGPQRDVAQILLSADIDPQSGSPSGKEAEVGAVKIRHILYSPDGSTTAAASMAPDDPAWKAAQDKANATYQRLLANPEQFATIAKTDSDDPGSASRGGVYWFSKNDSLLAEFAAAIFKPGLKPFELIAPIKTTAGWHVIQFLHAAPDAGWANTLKADIDAGKQTFANAARDNSDGPEAATGGDIGWVAKGQLSDALEEVIFATPVGKVSSPVTIDGTGTYMFLVKSEQTRTPDAAQKATIESNAFSTWYTKQIPNYKVTTDPSITGTSG